MLCKETINKIVKEFNTRYGADCKLLSLNKEKITVLFKGHICFTCGAYDYFEDLAMLFSEKLGEEYGISSYKQINDSYIVDFMPKNKIKEIKKDIRILTYD